MAIGKLIQSIRWAIVPVIALGLVDCHAVAQPTAPGFLSLPLGAKTRSLTHRRRDQYVPLDGDRSSLEYHVTLSIGTPKQEIRLYLGLDYNGFWVNPNCDTTGNDDKDQCEDFGKYDPTTSSTSDNTTSTFTESYTDGSGAEVTYFTDTITLVSGQPVTGVTFGVASNSSGFSLGFLGLGMGVIDEQNQPDSLVEQLAAQRVINSKVFSLALADSDTEDGGVLILGGIDTKKFSGELVANDILPPTGGDTYKHYSILMTSVGVKREDNSTSTYKNSSVTVGLDTGTTFTYLPQNIADSIFADLDATWIEDDEWAPVACSQQQNKSSFIFTFNDVAIIAPISDFVVRENDTFCYLGILPSSSASGYIILGLNFLRSTYAVYDQSLQKVSLGQYINCGTHDQSLPGSGADGFVGECEIPTDGTPTNTTPPPSTTATNTAPSGSKSTLSTGAKAGIGVGASVGGLAIIAALLFLFRRRRKTEAAQQPALPTSPEVQNAAYYIPQYPGELSGQPMSPEAAHYQSYHPSIKTPDTAIPGDPSRLSEMDSQQGDNSRYTYLSVSPTGHAQEHAELEGEPIAHSPRSPRSPHSPHSPQ